MKQKLLKTMLLLCALVAGSGNAWATDVTVTISTYASAHSWTNGTSYSSIAINSDVTATGLTNGNNSKYYSSNNSWRHYEGDSGTITIETSSGTLNSVTFTYTQGNNGVIKDGGTTIASGDEYDVEGETSVTFSVGHSSGTKNGNVQITAITVDYTPSGGGGGGGSSVDAPSFSPAAGAVTAGTTVTLTQASADAIRYTTDGTNPTKTTGTVYSAPIEITTAKTIKAIAIKGDEVSSVATAAYTITVAAPEYNLASSGNFLTGTGMTLTSAGNTIYYTLTTNGSDPATPSSSSTEYTGPIALSSGTNKFKAIAYDGYGNTSTVVSRTVNGIAPATLPFNWAGGDKSTLTALTGVIGSGLGSDYDSGTHSPYLVKYDTDGDFIEIFTNAQPLKVSVGVKMIGGKTTSKIKVQESTNGAEFSDVEELTISGAQNDILSLATTEDFASDTRVIKLLFVKGANVGIGPISIVGGSFSATLNSSGYATFASTYALDFSDDSEFSAWQIKGISGSTITFEQITGKVAAGTGVLLKGTASAAISIPVAASGTDISSTNLLEGITAATAVAAEKYYGLSGNTFKKVNAGTVPAGKALLPVAAVGVKEFLTFEFGDDDADGINLTPALSEGEGAIYNLAGQRISKMQKGINIVNGKKVLF